MAERVVTVRLPDRAAANLVADLRSRTILTRCGQPRRARVPGHPPHRCTAEVDLSVDDKTARRYGLTRGTRRGRRRARHTPGGSFKGRKLFHVRFTRAARRQMRGARRLVLRVEANDLAGSTHRRTARRSLTLTH